jgi:hypothetical protein
VGPHTRIRFLPVRNESGLPGDFKAGEKFTPPASADDPDDTAGNTSVMNGETRSLKYFCASLSIPHDSQQSQEPRNRTKVASNAAARARRIIVAVYHSLPQMERYRRTSRD